MDAQVKIDDVSPLAADVRALREEIRRLREPTPQSLVDLKAAASGHPDIGGTCRLECLSRR
jgi:hypothetical protein